MFFFGTIEDLLTYDLGLTYDVIRVHSDIFRTKGEGVLAEVLGNIVMAPHVRWGPCHHSMSRPRVADGGTASWYGG
jgi:hypothetical protein